MQAVHLIQMVNAESEDGIREWWPKYCNPGTAYEKGLRRRRYAELELFSENDPGNFDYCRRDVLLSAWLSLRPAGN